MFQDGLINSDRGALELQWQLDTYKVVEGDEYTVVSLLAVLVLVTLENQCYLHNKQLEILMVCNLNYL